MARERTRRVVDQVNQMLSTADHDLLIKISERLEGLVATCNALTEALRQKADAQDVTNLKIDHEARIRVLEHSNWRLAGALAALEVGIGVVLHYWKL